MGGWFLLKCEGGWCEDGGEARWRGERVVGRRVHRGRGV